MAGKRVVLCYAPEDRALALPVQGVKAALDAWEVGWDDVSGLLMEGVTPGARAGQQRADSVDGPPTLPRMRAITPSDIPSRSASLPPEIYQRIDRCEVFLRLCSPAIERSPNAVAATEYFRGLLARDRRRVLLNLVLDPDYQHDPRDADRLYIATAGKTRALWLEELAVPLGVATIAQRVSRRALIGMGAGFGIALLAGGVAAVEFAQQRQAQAASEQPLSVTRSSGQPRWSAQLGAPSNDQFDIPLIAVDGAHAYALMSGAVTAFNIATGAARRVQLRFPIENYQGDKDNPSGFVNTNLTKSIYVTGGYLFIRGAFRPSADTNPSDLSVARLSDGKLLWRTELTEYRQPQVAGDTVVFFAFVDNASGASTSVSLRAQSLSDGALLWTRDIRQGFAFDPAGVQRPMLAVSGQRVYVASLDHTISCLDLVSGKTIWSYLTGGETATPVVADQAVYVGSADYAVYALDAATGKIRWRYLTSGGVSAAPVVNGPAVYVTSEDGHIYALDAATGALYWRAYAGQSETQTPGNTIVTSPAIYRNVIVAAWRSTLFAFDLRTGKPLWNFAPIQSPPSLISAQPLPGAVCFCWAIPTSGSTRSTRDAAREMLGIGRHTSRTRSTGVRALMIGNGKMFISHTHVDNEACDPLLAALDAWQVDYWFDLEQLSAGQEFPDRIERGIAERDIFLRALTPAATRSEWMAREAAYARSRKDPRGAHRVINLMLQPGYPLSPQERAEIVIDATRQPDAAWLRQLRLALGIPSREPRFNRRAFLGLGAAGVAALGATAAAGKLLLFPDVTETVFAPTTRAATATPQSGPPAVLWRYRYSSQNGPVMMSTDSQALYVAFSINDTYATSMALARLEGATGARSWASYHGLPPAATPTLSAHALYMLATNELGKQDVYLLALDRATGAERWRSARLTNADQDASAILYSATVAASADTVVARWETTLAAFREATGAPLWRQPLAPKSFSAYQNAVSAPTISGQTVYVGGEDGSVAAYNLSAGYLVWRAHVAAARFSSAAAVAGNTVYIGSEDGYIYALDAATGVLSWKRALTPFLPQPPYQYTTFVTSAPSVVDGVVYIGSGTYQGELYSNTPVTGVDQVDDNLLALDARTGKTLWHVHPSTSRFPYAAYPVSALLRPGLRATPLVTGDTIYASAYLGVSDASGLPDASYLDALYALDRATGATRWSYLTTGHGEYPSAPVITSDGVVAFGSSQSLVLAFRP